MDPIYVSKIFLPQLNKNTLKVLFQILEENNPHMKSNVQLSEFMIFLASQKKKIEAADIDFVTIKVFLYRQVIENICYLLTRLSYSEHLWMEMKKEYFQEEAANPKMNPIPLLQQNVENNPPAMLRDIFYGGISPHQRPALWFSIMKGP